MNPIDSLTGNKAVLAYSDGDFEILEPGRFVTCAVSGKRIALDDLKYWSVDRQEAYADAAVAVEAMTGQKPLKS